MQIHNGSMTPSKSRFLCTAALLVIASAGLVESFQSTQVAAADATATYSHGVLRAVIPYSAPHAGAGQLTVEVLDPDDNSIARAEQSVTVTDSSAIWQEDLKLTNPIGVEDLAWHRLRYRFTYRNQKEPTLQNTESISQILLMPVIHILGQQSYLSGGPAAVRVVVTDSKNNPITGAGSLRIEAVAPDKKTVNLFNGSLNRRGTTEAQFRFPAGLVGACQLHYTVDTTIGSADFTQPGAPARQSFDSPHHGKTLIPARPNHPRARIGVGARQPRSNCQPWLDL